MGLGSAEGVVWVSNVMPLVDGVHLSHLCACGGEDE